MNAGILISVLTSGVARVYVRWTMHSRSGYLFLTSRHWKMEGCEGGREGMVLARR